MTLTNWPDQLPPDPWGTWKRFNVSETSKVFLVWLEDCKKIVKEGWELKVRDEKKFIYVTMQNLETKQVRPFAYVKKSTGDIHAPATLTLPFDYFVGNIGDLVTMFSIIGPYGVKVHWEWLPTHPKYKY